MQEQAEGVGPEAVIGEAVAGQGVPEVFDAVLGIATVDVEVVERERVIVAGGDDEAGVRAFEQDLGLEDDAARAGPGVSLIAGLASEADLRPTLFSALAAGFFQEWGRQPFERRVGG